MLHEIKHYGKSMTMFTEKEKELFGIDNEITNLFIQIHDEDTHPIEKMMLLGISSAFTRKRKEISAEILNLKESDYETVEDLLYDIEKTDYGFKKYLQDRKTNETKIEEIGLMAHLN